MQTKAWKKHDTNDTKKGSLSELKRLGVHSPHLCRDCAHSKVHSTGSQLWTSCKFQKGWRSINAECNLSEIPQNKGEETLKVTLYSSKNCPQCKALKRWLNQNNVSFTEKSLDNTEVMTELVMRNLVILATPAIETENRVYLSHQIFDDNSRLKPELEQTLRGDPSK